MKGKITLLVGGAVGYVLGTRAGREQFEKIKFQAQNVWTDPRVQEKATQAQAFAKEKASDAASSAAAAAKDKVSGGSQDSTPGTSPGTSQDTAQGTAPYPTSATTGLA